MAGLLAFNNLAPKTKNLVVAGGLTAFVFGVYFYTMRAVGGTDELQIGDVLDRGGEELKILYFLEKLKCEALKNGGKLITLKGNHDIMNVEGDSSHSIIARIAALRPDDPIARGFLANNATVLLVGDSVFVHGELLQKHVDYRFKENK
ncbi:hypothetical protein PTKIN_Ptkin09bG0279700 [Pterospermum kingtungense]